MDEESKPCAGKLDGGVHVFPVRVYYEDTDAGGVVYYANYLKFAERARTEMMHLLDAGYRDLITARTVAFAVRRCEVDFLAPARLDDVLEVRTSVTETGGASGPATPDLFIPRWSHGLGASSSCPIGLVPHGTIRLRVNRSPAGASVQP